MKKTSLFLLPLLAAACMTVQAQTTPAAPEAAASAPAEATLMSAITGNINVTTNYKYRGQDQGTLKGFSPAVQGGFDWSGLGGFYLGNWNSNISFAGNIEMDFYGGYKGEIVKDVGYDVGILQYYYPKNSDTSVTGNLNYNTTELYGALSYSYFSLKYSLTVSKDYFGIGRSQSNASGNDYKGQGTGYLDFSVNYPLIDKLTLNAHAGYTHYSSDLRHATLDSEGGPVDIGVPNYWDYKLGVTYDLGSGFSAAGAYVGASKKSFYGDVNSGRGILTLSKTM